MITFENLKYKLNGDLISFNSLSIQELENGLEKQSFQVSEKLKKEKELDNKRVCQLKELRETELELEKARNLTFHHKKIHSKLKLFYNSKTFKVLDNNLISIENLVEKQQIEKIVEWKKEKNKKENKQIT